jgi:hypothetical protein
MGLVTLQYCTSSCHHFDCSVSRLAKFIRRGILDLVDRLRSVRVGAQDHDATAELWSYRPFSIQLERSLPSLYFVIDIFRLYIHADKTPR